MKKSVKNEIIALVVFVILTAAFIVFAERVTTPKRYDYGSTWGQFAQEAENSIDVVFYGSSIAYCDIVPSVIWDETGITSYVMAGPEQTVPFSYYYVRQTYKTQTPKLICLEVTGMFFKEYQDYTQINVGYMPFGINRLGATLNASEPEQREGLIFPLYNYHSRWSSLEPADWSVALHGYDADNLAGYTFLQDSQEISEISLRGEEYNAENYAKNLDYLKKMADFCSERGTKVLFFIAPTCWRLSDEHLAMLKSDLESIDGAEFIDFNGLGLEHYDLNTDFFDNLHFNCFGAEKFSTVLAETISSDFGLSPTENADSALWTQRSTYFKNLSDGNHPVGYSG